MPYLSQLGLYTKPALEALQKCNLHGIGHITGGAFSKLTRLKNLRYEIESLPKMPPIMALIEEAGVAEKRCIALLTWELACA